MGKLSCRGVVAIAKQTSFTIEHSSKYILSQKGIRKEAFTGRETPKTPTGSETPKTPTGLETHHDRISPETCQAYKDRETFQASTDRETCQAPTSVETSQAPTSVKTSQASVKTSKDAETCARVATTSGPRTKDAATCTWPKDSVLSCKTMKDAATCTEATKDLATGVDKVSAVPIVLESRADVSQSRATQVRCSNKSEMSPLIIGKFWSYIVENFFRFSQ